MTHLKRFGIIVVALALSACESMSPATYSNFADNSVALRMYPNAKLAVTSMDDMSRFDSGCRLVGPITASGNRTVPQFIYDSFNEELKFANLYSTEQGAAQLKLTLLAASFSSVSGLTGGWWDFTVKLDNPANGRSVTANTKYDFQSGFSAVAACQNVSVSLTPAVQRVINKAITDPNFRALVSP
jgi:hypothetical protein